MGFLLQNSVLRCGRKQFSADRNKQRTVARNEGSISPPPRWLR
jgi:hypothetical protein